MSRPLPLQALRAFVEVGQHGSIKAAAAVLNVTSGAVSQQIRLLEERVGLALFTRERQGLRLTQTGAAVYPALHEAFAQIARASEALEQIQARQTLTVSTVATFAASWLVPRLGASTSATRKSKCGWRPRRPWWIFAATGWTWPCATAWGSTRGCTLRG